MGSRFGIIGPLYSHIVVCGSITLIMHKKFKLTENINNTTLIGAVILIFIALYYKVVWGDAQYIYTNVYGLNFDEIRENSWVYRYEQGNIPKNIEENAVGYVEATWEFELFVYLTILLSSLSVCCFNFPFKSIYE